MQKPEPDPTPIFELFRGAHATELLTAAVAHFNLFGRLAHTSLSVTELQESLELESRPATVLLTALKAFGLIREVSGLLELTDMARQHLIPGTEFDVGDYIGLAANSPGVLEMVARLKSNVPAGQTRRPVPGSFIVTDLRQRWKPKTRPVTSRWPWPVVPGMSHRFWPGMSHCLQHDICWTLAVEPAFTVSHF
ncbi:MAG: hypothetical protein VB858_05170 [Planctomycetaceae bacterium]